MGHMEDCYFLYMIIYLIIPYIIILFHNPGTTMQINLVKHHAKITMNKQKMLVSHTIMIYFFVQVSKPDNLRRGFIDDVSGTDLFQEDFAPRDSKQQYSRW